MKNLFTKYCAVIVVIGVALGLYSCNVTHVPVVQNETVAEKYETFTIEGVNFNMVFVEGGTFTMGATSEQDKYQNKYEIPRKDEYPTHLVTLSDYYIGETEVTQALWKAVRGHRKSWNWSDNSSVFKGDERPVENVTYKDVIEFIELLNQKTGRKFRLPTEAEWEYAARGGQKSKGYRWSGSDTLGFVAWYVRLSPIKTQEVKRNQPNELGIFDMSGNVSEMCSDIYDKDYYKESQNSINPKGPEKGKDFVVRGGNFNDYHTNCRVSARQSLYIKSSANNVGFRLVLEP